MAETVFNEGSINGTNFRVESDTNANMFFVDGADDRIGIGTNSPSNMLHVAEDKANEFAAFIINDNADGSGLRVRADDTSDDEYILYCENGTTPRFLIKCGGNIGVGTASPVSQFEVNNSASTIALNTAATATFTLDPPDVSNGTYLFGDGSSGGDQVQILAVNDSAANQNEYAGIGFAMKTSGNTVTTLAGIAGIKENDTDGAGGDVGALAFGCRTTGDYIKEKMRITSGGDIGIGDATPSTALTSFGSASRGISIKNAQPTIALTDSDTGSGHFWIANGGGISYFQNTVSGATFRFYVESTVALEIENDGVLKSSDGIEFEGTALGAGQTGIASSGDGGDLRIYTNGTESWNFDSNGNCISKVQSNGKSHNIKFAGSATYANGAYTSHTLPASSNLVYKSAGSFTFTVKNDSTGSKAIGVGIIGMHES